MKRLFLLLLFSILFTGCQSNETLSWGETYTTENLKITPIDLQVITDSEFLTEYGQEVVVDIELKNTSDTDLTIDRGFYYNSLGVLHTEEMDGEKEIISRMDLEAFPFDVYTCELEEGQSVETQLIMITGLGEVLELVFDGDGGLEKDNYEVSWQLN
ncbi:MULTISPECIES: hypothetical protein [Bacillaceae]|uniref:DUF4352 domain-containing protein n=1 Tax=Evansella alkalicola TaxID=745819 RepID=A0ABS6JST2_9BACI|nr:MULTISPECIES: hypothetical protein [Bacillaceae]MBU9721633.1 hypothetical protein [Bacillus alkalicola]